MEYVYIVLSCEYNEGGEVVFVSNKYVAAYTYHLSF